MEPIDLGAAFKAEATKPDLLFDTADTISFQLPLLLTLLNSQFGTDYEYINMTKNHPLPIKKKQRKWLKKQKNEPATYLNLCPDFHAIDTLQRLHIAGFHIIMSSDRPASMEGVTREWYDHWHVPYDEMVIDGPDSKADIIKEHGPDHPIIMFDDDPRQMLVFPRDGVEVWTARKPWTPDHFLPHNCFIFDDWNEVIDRLAPQYQPAQPLRQESA